MSVSRACDFYLATDKKWYVMLGIDEHDEDWEDCFAIGPFASLESAEAAIAKAPYPNTGGSLIDDSGTTPPPETQRLNTPCMLSKGNLSR